MTTHLTLLELWHEAEITSVLGVGSWFMFFPLKTFVRKVANAWNEQGDLLKGIKEELVAQRTNCLKTLQDQGVEQVETLGKIATSLETMHTQQAELSGYIRGLAERH